MPIGIDPQVLADTLVTVRAAVPDEQLVAMFERSMTQNLAAVSESMPDGTTFVLTGDIPAMWLRDSATQIRPYLILCGQDPALQDVLIGVLQRQLEFIAIDPYANSYKRTGDASWHTDDLPVPVPEVWERKYEIDSLCFPLELAYRLWRVTGRSHFIDHDRFRTAAKMILDLWTRELDHERNSDYRFQRFNCPASDTLTRDGLGDPIARTGMSWSAFRPSDDACRYNFNVPGNMFAVVVLGYLEELATEVLNDAALAARAADLRATIDAGITEFGVVKHPVRGEVFAYETDGLGNVVMMDDANMPSLLSIPLTGYRPASDPTYLATRSLVLSEENPYFYQGKWASGIGSPHTWKRYVWPIALAVQGLTTSDLAEKRRLLELLRDTTGGTGQMHESFDVDDPTKFTREWFSWANAMLCELILDVAGLTFERACAEGGDSRHRPPQAQLSSTRPVSAGPA